MFRIVIPNLVDIRQTLMKLILLQIPLWNKLISEKKNQDFRIPPNNLRVNVIAILLYGMAATV